MRKAGRANICHPEVCLLLSLTACLAALESQLISKVWPSPGQGTQPPWRGGNTWHCSGAIPAASYSQQHCSLWGHGKQIAQQLLQKLRCSEWGEKTKTHTYGSTCGIAQISEQHKYHIYLACQSKVWASIYWWGGATKPASDSICSLPSNCFVVLCHREQPLRNLRIVVNPGKWRKGRPHDSFHSKEIFSFPLCYCSSCFQSLNTNLRALHERYSSLGIITTAATDGSF